MTGTPDSDHTSHSGRIEDHADDPGHSAAPEPARVPAPEPDAPRAAAALLERLAEKLGGVASARAVYGEPVTRDGVTVIPVVRVIVGLGGGAIRERTAEGEGEGGGGGGGAWARPVGFIELRGDAATYRPLRAPWSEALLPLVGGVLAGTLGARLARSVRARRGR